MTESFILELTHKGEKRAFDAEFQKPSHFTHRMIVHIDGAQVSFEPDEERNYRAVLSPESPQAPNADLVRAVADKLHELFQF